MPALTRLAVAAVLLAAGPALAVAGPDHAPLSNGQGSPAEIAARETIERWLAAQNGGRFDDYAALYAPGFAGVKRAGKAVKKMNRAAWLKDRKTMFKAAMKVSAADLKVTVPATGGPIVELTQTWQSGAYADVGPKRIVLDAAGTLIVAEELLSSRVILTDGACLTTVYPGASVKKMRTGEDDGGREVKAIDLLDLGGRWACTVQVARDGGVDATVAVLSFGKKWEMKANVDESWDVARDADDGVDTSGGISVTALPLHATIPVLEVTVSTRRDEPGASSTEDKTTVYRADGDTLAELFSYGLTASGGETDESSSCERQLLERRRKGWLDVDVTCTDRKHFYHGEDPPETEETTTTHYRWDGSDYIGR